MRMLTPPTIAPPFARYAHGVEVPAGARLVVISGQLPLHPDGTVPEGPAAQADLCFAMCAAILAEAGALKPDPSPGSPGDRYRLDIRLAARAQLLNAGLGPGQLRLCPLCTVAEPQLFHSWRRDQVKAVQWSGIVAQG
jgi:hypothetical protein